MPRIVLDTDVASLSYKGRLSAPLAARLAGSEICVTFVTVAEPVTANDRLTGENGAAVPLASGATGGRFPLRDVA
jgi:predicted nucleic acid-binding protein